MSSILGMWEVVWDKETGKWVVQEYKIQEPPGEPVYKPPINLHNDPEYDRWMRTKIRR